jgi:hypothetical protein
MLGPAEYYLSDYQIAFVLNAMIWPWQKWELFETLMGSICDKPWPA